MRFLLIPLGAFVGALIARGFFLDAADELVFRAAWAAIDVIHITTRDVRLFLKTDAGQKIAAGAVIGLVSGFAVAWMMGKLRPARAKVR